jgi:hypothetical protein
MPFVGLLKHFIKLLLPKITIIIIAEMMLITPPNKNGELELIQSQNRPAIMEADYESIKLIGIIL